MKPPRLWLTRIVIILGILAFIGILINTSVFVKLFPIVSEFDELPSWAEVSGSVVGCVLIVNLVFHVFALFLLTWQNKILQNLNLLKGVTYALGVVSIVLIFSNVALLSDIGNQYEAGLSTKGEWYGLAITHSFHVVFVLFSLFVIQQNARLLIGRESVDMPKHDLSCFLASLYSGVTSGLLGMIMILYLILSQFPERYYTQAIVVFTGVVILPVLFSSFVWVLQEKNFHLIKWFDEKQRVDAGNAAFISLCVSIPLLWALHFIAPFFLSGLIIAKSAVPFVTFLCLFLFSSTFISFSKNA